LSVTGPEHAAAAIPDRVARAFEVQALRRRDDGIDHTACTLRFEERTVVQFLTLPLGAQETRQHHLAIEHHGRVCGEHHVRQATLGRLHVDARAERFVGALQLGPAVARVARQTIGRHAPIGGIHPRIDAVADLEEIRRAHHQVRGGGCRT